MEGLERCIFNLGARETSGIHEVSFDIILQGSIGKAKEQTHPQKKNEQQSLEIVPNRFWKINKKIDCKYQIQTHQKTKGFGTSLLIQKRNHSRSIKIMKESTPVKIEDISESELNQRKL